MRDLIAKGRFFCNHQTRRRRRHIVDNSKQAKPQLKRSLETAAATGKSLGRLWQSQKISIILDNNRNPWNLCIQNRDIPFWSCLPPPDTLPLPVSSFTYWHNKIPGLSKNISGINKPCAHSVSGVPRVSRVSGVSISLLDQKIAHFWSKSEQNRCFKCSTPKRNSSPSELPFG